MKEGPGTPGGAEAENEAAPLLQSASGLFRKGILGKPGTFYSGKSWRSSREKELEGSHPLQLNKHIFTQRGS